MRPFFFASSRTQDGNANYLGHYWYFYVEPNFENP